MTLLDSVKHCYTRCTRAMGTLTALVLFMPAAIAQTQHPDTGPHRYTETPASHVTVTLPDYAESSPVAVMPGGPFRVKQYKAPHVIHDLLLRDDLAFVAAGEKGLAITNLTSGEALYLPAGFEPAQFTRLEFIGPDHLVALNNKRLVVFDIRKPLEARHVSQHVLPRQITHLTTFADNVYAVTVDNMLHRLRLNEDASLVPLAQVQLGGQTESIAANAGVVLVTAGKNGVIVFDINDPTRLILAGQYHTTWPATTVLVDNNRAYVATGRGGLVLLDLTQAGQPQWLGSHSRLGYVTQLDFVDDTRVAVSNRRGDIYIVDTRNPAFPTIDTSFRSAQSVSDMSVHYPMLALGGEDVLTLFDISPRAPLVSNENLDVGEGVNLGGQRKAWLEDNILYVADWFSGIHLYDVSNPHSPRLRSSFHTPGSPKGIIVKDGYAYVADDDHGLAVIDVHDVDAPRHVTRLPTSGLAYTPVIENNTLYLASHHDGFHIIDISEPESPQLTGHFNTPGKAWSIAVSNGIAYVADSEAGLLIFDVSNPAQPRALGKFHPEGNAEDILLHGDTAYVAFFDAGVYVLDISKPGSPRPIAHLPTPGDARGLERVDDRLFIADWLAGIHVVDISDVEKPRVLGSFDTDGAAWGVRVARDQAYVLDWWGGLSVIDVSQPRQLKLTAQYGQPSLVVALAIKDQFLFAAQRHAGLQVYDIRNPLNPTWATAVELPGIATQVAVAGEVAMVALGDSGLALVDISNPFQARLIDVDKDRPTRLVRAHDNRAYRAYDNIVERLDVRDDGRLESQWQITQAVADLWPSDNHLLIANHEDELHVVSASDGKTEHRRQLDFLPSRVRSNGDGNSIYLVEQGRGIHLFRQTDDQVQAVTLFPLQDEIHDLQVKDGHVLVSTANQGIVVLDATHSNRIYLAQRYNLTSRHQNLLPHGDFVYAAGDMLVLALKRLPRVNATSSGNNRATLTVPGILPTGQYSVIYSAGDEEQQIQHNAFRVTPPRFSKPQLKLDDFRILLEQHRKNTEIQSE
jgi:hypothetical protein